MKPKCWFNLNISTTFGNTMCFIWVPNISIRIIFLRVFLSFIAQNLCMSNTMSSLLNVCRMNDEVASKVRDTTVGFGWVSILVQESQIGKTYFCLSHSQVLLYQFHKTCMSPMSYSQSFNHCGFHQCVIESKAF